MSAGKNHVMINQHAQHNCSTHRIHNLEVVGLVGHLELLERVALGGDLGAELGDLESDGDLVVERLVDVLHGDLVALLPGAQVTTLPKTKI